MESYEWNCDDQGLYYYGQPLAERSKQAANGYWHGFTSPINPFVPSGWRGTCSFPQITSDGLEDSWTHGHDLYGVYHDLLAFLPDRVSNDWRSKVLYRVTNNVITSQVAGMVINGMWDTTDSIPLLIQATGIDSLEPQYSCDAGASLFDAIKSSSNPDWQQHLDSSAGLFATLDDISGVPEDDSGFHASFDHYFDNLSARQCHEKPLPCKLVDGQNSTADCVDQTLADAVYRMGQWEYSQIYRDANASLSASVASYGVWIAELSTHLRDVVAGKGGTLYLHNVAHDGSTSRVLSILQADVMVSLVITSFHSSLQSPSPFANLEYDRCGPGWGARSCLSCTRNLRMGICLRTRTRTQARQATIRESSSVARHLRHLTLVSG